MLRYLLLLGLLWFAPQAAEWDVLIENGRIYDGSGGHPRVADVALKGERIVRIGELDRSRAARAIDAKNMVVCPGFIDLHTHSDDPILDSDTRSNLNYLHQGCTLVITGNCGGGHVDTRSYFAKIETDGAGTNVGHLLPHGSIREKVMGSVNRAPTAEEMEAMLQLVRQGMADGAAGMSTGLIYVPGAYAKTDELITLAAEVGRHGGFYASHIRSESDELVEAVDEAITIGRKGGCAVHVSHLKAGGRKNWGSKIRQAAAMIEAARAAGMKVTADQYPYIASSTSLAANLLSSEVREGGSEKVRARLDDPAVVRAVAEKIASRGADTIMIASFRADPSYNGKRLDEIARKEQKAPAEMAIDILKRGGAQGIFFGMNEEDVRWAMARKWVATASDGGARKPDGSHPHPRSYGTFPRKIGYYAIQLGIVPLEQAIHSATGLPASVLGLPDRGLVREGYVADLLVFDPKTFRDTATFTEPHKYAPGVRYLWVNGVTAIDGGKYTGALAGRPVRRPQAGRVSRR